jgi:hypothetical protein
MTKLIKRCAGIASRTTTIALRPIVQLMPEGSLARYYRRATFRSVYKLGEWGAREDSRFFSGVGSYGECAARYADAMAKVIAAIIGKTQETITIVDLGCGDFSIGSQLLAYLPPVRYIGCDVVPELVCENQERYGGDRIEFRAIDIVSDELPDGDVCTVRQVLQHLPNRDITRVLAKLRKYQSVYVTEGQPLIRIGSVNPDKPSSAEVRFDWRTGLGRGVELDQPPYNLPVEEICRVSAPSPDREVIITYKVDLSG